MEDTPAGRNGGRRLVAWGMRRKLIALCIIGLTTVASAGPVDDLAALDGRVRDAARKTLIREVLVDDLTAFRDQLEALPADERWQTREVARTIVLHAYLRQQSIARQELALRAVEQMPQMAERNVGKGFLGVQGPGRRDTADMRGPIRAPGVVVGALLPGHVASQVLEDGDVMMAVSQINDQGRGIGITPVNDFQSLIFAIGGLPAGQNLRFFIQRGGYFKSVDLALDVRTTAVGAAASTPDLSKPMEEAEARWAAEFEPLFN